MGYFNILVLFWVNSSMRPIMAITSCQWSEWGNWSACDLAYTFECKGTRTRERDMRENGVGSICDIIFSHIALNPNCGFESGL